MASPLPMLLPCSHYRWDGKRHGCAILGECKPIEAGPDLRSCRLFHNHHHARKQKPPAKQTEAKPPCANLGEPTGDLATCHSCQRGTNKDGSKLKVMECSVFGKCTTDPTRKAVGIASCGGCSSYRKPGGITPTSTVTVNLPDHYNCSLLRWRDQTLLASRFDRNGKAGVYLSELDADLQPIWTYELEMHSKGKRITAEDPRLFVHQDKLHVSFSTYNGKAADMAVAELTHDLQVERVWLPQYTERNSWEKSWLFFNHGDLLYSLYSVNPHVVLVHAGDHAAKIHQVSHKFRWPVHMRGGSIALHNGEYYHFFHTTKKSGNHWLYTMGLYVFSATPPFQPLRAIREPVYTPNERERPIGFPKSVIFPCGAVLQDGQWLVSAGVHDAECRIIAFDAVEIEKVLVKI